MRCSVIVGCSHDEDGSGEHSDRDAVDDDDENVVVVFHTTIIVEIATHVQSYGDKMSEKQYIGLWDPYRFHAASMATLKYPDEFRNGTPKINNGTPRKNNRTPKNSYETRKTVTAMGLREKQLQQPNPRFFT